MNEIGKAMCRLPNGQTVYGPQTSGTPTSVNVKIQCPAGSKFFGIWHTHPGGIPEPSRTDVESGLRVEAETLCILVPNTGVTKCHNIQRGIRRIPGA